MGFAQWDWECGLCNNEQTLLFYGLGRYCCIYEGAMQRKDLLSGALPIVLLRKGGGTLQTASDITATLRRTRQTMAEQLEHAAANTQLLGNRLIVRNGAQFGLYCRCRGPSCCRPKYLKLLHEQKSVAVQR
jgi:hypothetical protein